MIKLQASSIHRIMQCPPSARLESKIDKECAVQYAARAADTGKKYHAAAELVLRGSTVARALKDVGIKKGSEEWVTGKYTVRYYTKYVKKIAKKYALSMERKIEQTIGEFRLVAKYDVGFLDTAKHVIHIFDLKTGSRDYSGSAFDQLRFTGWLISSINTMASQAFVYHIVQPNYYDEARKVVCEFDILTPELVKDRLEGIMHKVEECESYHLGNHCTFCPALAICPAYHKNEVMSMNTDVVRVEDISDDQLERIVLKKKEIENFLSACEEYVKNKLEKGYDFENIQIVTSKGRRQWIDDNKAVDALGELMPDDVDLYELKVKSPAQIEKVLGKDALEGLTRQTEYKRIAIKKSPFDVIE